MTTSECIALAENFAKTIISVKLMHDCIFLLTFNEHPEYGGNVAVHQKDQYNFAQVTLKNGRRITIGSK